MNFELCSTYPQKLIFPKNIKRNALFDSAKFRSYSRLPTVCWIHPQNKATLSRSSQPLTGIIGSISLADQLLVASLNAHKAEESNGSEVSHSCYIQNDPQSTINKSGAMSYISFMGEKNKSINHSSSKFYILDCRSKWQQI